MKRYLTKQMAVEALKRMQSFHDAVVHAYSTFGMDLLDDLGRRNIVMSKAQEKFFSQVLSEAYSGVEPDGKTGQPDIVIGELGVELECKLTSRHKSGSITLQTDFETLERKGSLDYLYVIAGPEFKDFCVLHFEGLTVDDFRSLSPGARGKVAMYKWKAMSKCNVLVGNVRNISDERVKQIEKQVAEGLPPAKERTLLASKHWWSSNPARYSIELEEV